VTKPTGDKPTGDLKTALSWCCIGLRQLGRVREGFGALRTDSLSADAQDSADAGWESSRLRFLFWGDVHFLITATYQMNKALEGMPSGPSLPQPLDKHVGELRHMVEHWEDTQKGDLGKGAWEGMAVRHGPVATPWSVTSDGSDGSDLRIGPRSGVSHSMDRTAGAPDYDFSLRELERVLTRILDELRQLDTEEEAHPG
jgi:hypothetical protein